MVAKINKEAKHNEKVKKYYRKYRRCKQIQLPLLDSLRHRWVGNMGIERGLCNKGYMVCVLAT